MRRLAAILAQAAFRRTNPRMLLTIALVITGLMAYFAKKAKRSTEDDSVSAFLTPPPGWTPDTMARVPSADINLIPLYFLPWVLWNAGARTAALASAAVVLGLRLILRAIAREEPAPPAARKAGELVLPDALPDGPLRAPPRSAALAFARRAVLPWVLPLTREPYFGGILGGAIAQSATTLAPWLTPVVQKALHEGGLMGFLFSLVVCVAELTARDLERKYGPRGKD